MDFNFEVQRSLAACQAVVLLVDANEVSSGGVRDVGGSLFRFSSFLSSFPQGVQAQTVANFFLAFELDLAVIPVLNKIDLPGAQPEAVKQQLKALFDIEPETVLEVRVRERERNSTLNMNSKSFLL